MWKSNFRRPTHRRNVLPQLRLLHGVEFPRHRRDVVLVTASARWRGESRRSAQQISQDNLPHCLISTQVLRADDPDLVQLNLRERRDAGGPVAGRGRGDGRRHVRQVRRPRRGGPGPARDGLRPLLRARREGVSSFLSSASSFKLSMKLSRRTFTCARAPTSHYPTQAGDI